MCCSGYGVFVDDDNHISRGDFILEYTGKLITTAEADEIDDQSYIYYFELQGKTFA
jgi:hypothetical protein